MAGVVGLELRNPLGSKSARVAAGSSGNLAETARQRLCSRLSCGVAVMQLRQGFPLALPHRGWGTLTAGAVQYAWLVGFELWNAKRK